MERAKAMEPGQERELAMLQAETALVRAMQAPAEYEQSASEAMLGIFDAQKQIEGDAVASALLNIKKLQDQLKLAQTRGDEVGVANIQAQLLQAGESLRQAQLDERNTLFTIRAAQVSQDPVAQAQNELARLRALHADVNGAKAKNEVYAQIIEAERTLNNAMSDVRMSTYDLRAAELQALGDSVGVAQSQVAKAQMELQNAAASGAGTAQMNQLRAALINAETNARDTIFQDRMADYTWMYDMEHITRSQYVNYLEGLKSTLIPGTRQFKDLELQIKRLRDETSSNLQANLPTSLALPTLYEVRRFSQSTSGFGPGNTAGIGYQDNRNMNIQIVINQNQSRDEIVEIMGEALGVGRNGNGVRRR